VRNEAAWICLQLNVSYLAQRLSTVAEVIFEDETVTELSRRSLTMRKEVLALRSEAPYQGRNHESASIRLSPNHFSILLTAVCHAAGRQALLGISVCPDRLGQASQPAQDHGIFREPQHSISRLQRSFHRYAGVHRRHPPYARVVLASDRISSRLQYVRGLLDSRSRGTRLDLFRSR